MDSVGQRWTTPHPRPFTPGTSPPATIEEWIHQTGDHHVAAAWDLIRRSTSPVFLTGPAGTGKSRFLQLYRSQSTVRTVALAATGIAAVHISAQTLHSYFHLPPRVLLPTDTGPTDRISLYAAVDEIIVDEAGMVRADLIDAMDRILRRARGSPAPFGGARLILFGDPLQLPPVVTARDQPILQELGYPGPHFFQARVFRDVGLHVAMLERIHRQKDRDFAELLSRVRQGRLSAADRGVLDQRVCPPDWRASEPPWVLTTTRAMARQVNAEQLKHIAGAEVEYVGRIEGSFPRRRLPAPQRLALKAGARVLFIRNDTAGRWANGSRGTVAACGRGEIVVRLDGGETQHVHPVTWEWIQYASARQAERPEVVGWYTQLPCVLGWAATIHRAQGQTLDNVRVDLGTGAFAPGHAYVAISRARTLQGLELTRPIRPGDVWVDRAVEAFLEERRVGERGHDAA